MEGMGGFSGTVGGHVIPGSFFAGFGLFFLLLTARRMFKAESSQDFCASHIPERDMGLLRRVGLVIVVCTLFGIFIEGLGGELFLGEAGHSFFRNLQHITLYSLFCATGFVAIFESMDWMPQDSNRVAAAAAFLGEGLIWHEHSLMKMNLVDQRIHALVAYTSFGASICMVLSIFRPNQPAFYIGGFFCILWQGLWLLAAAYNIASETKFDLEEMTSYFILEGLFLGCFVVFFVIMMYRKNGGSQVMGDTYLRVQLKADDEEDEEASTAIHVV